MSQKVRKTYRLEVEDQLAIEAIEYLTKAYISKHKNLVDAVSEFAINFFNKERLGQKKKLVTEIELVKIARNEGLTTGKSSIVQYRRKGVLKDNKGPWFYQNDQHKVVYDLDKMLEFLKKRSLAPKSRIIDATGRKLSREVTATQ